MATPLLKVCELNKPNVSWAGELPWKYFEFVVESGQVIFAQIGTIFLSVMKNRCLHLQPLQEDMHSPEDLQKLATEA